MRICVEFNFYIFSRVEAIFIREKDCGMMTMMMKKAHIEIRVKLSRAEQFVVLLRGFKMFNIK
jgi:hypothetical protein